MTRFAVLLSLLLCSVNAFSEGSVRYLDFDVKAKENTFEKSLSPFQNDPYFEISEIKVTEMETVEGDERDLGYEKSLNIGDLNDQLGQIITTVDKLIALGTKIWTIIEKGRPVLNTNLSKPISVLPNGNEDPTTAFYNMSGWSFPKSMTYKVEYKNLLGMTVIGFNYTVYFQHSGQFEGAGNYLTGVTVKASNVSVSWGFAFDASSELETISNLGSMDDPIAGASLRVNYKASSVLKTIDSSETFHVAGDGRVSKF